MMEAEPGRAEVAQSDGPEPRTSARAPVRAEVTLESDDNFFKGFSENISEGGIFVTTYDVREIGDEVDVEFTLPDGEEARLSVRTEVRWLREYNSFRRHVDQGMGLRFLDLNEADRERIERFVQQRDPMFYDD